MKTKQDKSVRKKHLAMCRVLLEAFIQDPGDVTTRSAIADFIEENLLSYMNFAEYRRFFLDSLKHPFWLRVAGFWKNREGIAMAAVACYVRATAGFAFFGVSVKALPDRVFAALLGDDTRNAARLVRVQDARRHDLRGRGRWTRNGFVRPVVRPEDVRNVPIEVEFRGLRWRGCPPKARRREG